MPSIDKLFLSLSTCCRFDFRIRLQKAQNHIIERWEDLGFNPVVDKDFFIEHPYDTLDYSDFLGNHKELMMGTNLNEGALFMTGGNYRAPLILCHY